MVQENHPGNCKIFVHIVQCCIAIAWETIRVFIPGNPGRCTLFLGKSYEKIVQEKDPGNDPYVARVARF
jgi:hypothetical protein